MFFLLQGNNNNNNQKNLKTPSSDQQQQQNNGGCCARFVHRKPRPWLSFSLSVWCLHTRPGCAPSYHLMHTLNVLSTFSIEALAASEIVCVCGCFSHRNDANVDDDDAFLDHLSTHSAWDVSYDLILMHCWCFSFGLSATHSLCVWSSCVLCVTAVAAVGVVLQFALMCVCALGEREDSTLCGDCVCVCVCVCVCAWLCDCVTCLFVVSLWTCVVFSLIIAWLCSSYTRDMCDRDADRDKR